MVQDQLVHLKDYENQALKHLRDAQVAHETLTGDEIARRYPQLNPEGLRWGIFERDAGYILAKRSCEAVLDGFLAEGGTYRQAYVNPGEIQGGRLRGVTLSDGSTVEADMYVFACGAWMGSLFPEVLGSVIRASLQEVFTFGTPAGVPSFEQGAFPGWVDHGDRLWYGIPGSDRRGFKIADDTHGPDLDPTSAERVVSPSGLERAREFMEYRFPGLKGAPLLESQVAQYPMTPDTHFVIDRHPAANNLWFVGGGSCHGFKHGPAIGEHVAARILDDKPVEPLFSLARFSS